MEVEYRTNGEEVYLLGINSRLWKWAMIIAKKYPNFTDCIYSPACRKSFAFKDYFPPIAFDILDIRDLGPLSFLFNRKRRKKKASQGQRKIKGEL